jgi:lactoylglutathione lyase
MMGKSIFGVRALWRTPQKIGYFFVKYRKYITLDLERVEINESVNNVIFAPTFPGRRTTLITDLGHLAFTAYDLERSLAFYAKLGLHESFRLHHEDGTLMLVYLHITGDRFIEVFPNGPAPDPQRPGSFMHLCLLVDDLRGTVEQFQKEGVAIEQEPKVGLDHNLQAWIRDPDGNPIELMQLVEISPQRRVARGEKARI